ncbi:MAG: hypothetical protein GY804_11905 [Alphaproteobacteria bacterium]|nr:hypothetical protein [Alphaproteobacteria bacterium]
MRVWVCNNFFGSVVLRAKSAHLVPSQSDHPVESSSLNSGGKRLSQWLLPLWSKKLHLNEVKVYFLRNQWQKPLTVPPIPPLFGVWLNWLCRAAGDLCKWLGDVGNSRRLLCHDFV